GPVAGRARARVAGLRDRRLVDEPGGVLDPGERRPIEAWALDHLLAGVRERDEMAGEIAAVDGRNVLRLERVAVLRVVPVVEVAAEALEGMQRLQRGLETLDDVERANPTEI